jgi:cell division protease FtsH
VLPPVHDRVDEFGELFAEFVRRSLEAESKREPAFRTLIRAHVGADPNTIPVVSLEVPDWDHANLQVAIEALIAKEGSEADLVGIGGGQKRYMSLSLSDLINAPHFEPGPVEYDSLEVGPGATHRCILFGLVMLRTARGPAVVFIRRAEQQAGPGAGLMVEALAEDAEYASALLDEIRVLMREHNIFRGQMFSLESTMWGQLKVVFHERPTTTREELILPEEVLSAIERQTLGIARRADALRAAGRHLKRGILLHGPPGTGKTHTISWLAAQLDGATVVVLSGGALGAVGPVSRLARELAPSLVVLEDVDLVAEERTLMHGGGAILFELLNELDGMADDADVTVVLTTNRPDLLEPALAARPGRVDIAVEVPLPNLESRRRLFELYAKDIPLEALDVDAVANRTEGVTAAFFKELLRQAVLEAAERGGDQVGDDDLRRALDRLLEHAGAMTRILLGAERRDPSPGAPDPHGWLLQQRFAIEQE